jgi:hypothetical protein
MMTPAIRCLACESGFPLGDTRNWVMMHHRAGAYAPEASCRAGANEKPDRKDAAMNRHPDGSEDSLRVA